MIMLDESLGVEWLTDLYNLSGWKENLWQLQVKCFVTGF